MDRIKITIEQEFVDDGAMFVSVYINGQTMPKMLNLDAFFAVKEQQGQVPLFTCGCGDFGCGGYYVDVVCTNEALTLHNSYHRFNHTLQAEFEYLLEWQQVRGVAEEIVTCLQKVQERNPQAFVTLGHCGENLLDRINEYRRSRIFVS